MAHENHAPQDKSNFHLNLVICGKTECILTNFSNNNDTVRDLKVEKENQGDWKICFYTNRNLEDKAISVIPAVTSSGPLFAYNKSKPIAVFDQQPIISIM